MTHHEPRVLDAFERQVGRLSRRVRRAVADRAHLLHPELQSAGYVVLAWLVAVGPSRSADAVEALGLDKAAVSRQVRSLLDLGLVERTRDPDDGRAWLLAATPQAAAEVRALSVARTARLDERLAGWPADDFVELVSLLTRYNETMDAADQAASRA